MVTVQQPINQEKGSASITWDDANFPWEEGAGPWDNPYNFVNQIKNNAVSDS